MTNVIDVGAGPAGPVLACHLFVGDSFFIIQVIILHFLLTVDLISENSLASIQWKLAKYTKRWLNLPRCCTLAAIYHQSKFKDIIHLEPQSQTWNCLQTGVNVEIVVCEIKGRYMFTI